MHVLMQACIRQLSVLNLSNLLTTPFCAMLCCGVLCCAPAVEAHADPAEVKYWKEVDQEELIVASGSESD